MHESRVLSREEEIYWIALTLVPGLGTRTANKLLDRFRTPQAIFRSSRTELETAGVSAAIGAIDRQRMQLRGCRYATAKDDGGGRGGDYNRRSTVSPGATRDLRP